LEEQLDGLCDWTKGKKIAVDRLAVGKDWGREKIAVKNGCEIRSGLT